MLPQPNSSPGPMTVSPASRSAILFIFITILVDTIGFGLIMPTLPELLMELGDVDLGDAARINGWLAFVYAVTQFFFAPVLGNLSDRFGRRPVLLFSLTALGIDYLVMGLSEWIGVLFLGRLIAGAAGASFTTGYAYIADLSLPEKRAQNFGLMGAAFGGGFIIGPAIGGLLGELGPRVPFFAAAALSLANVMFGYFVLPESLARESRRPFEWKRANPLGTLLQMRKYPAVLGIAAVMFLWQIAHQVLPATWSFYTMYRFGWSEAAVGASLAFAGVVIVLGQGLLVRKLIPWLGGERRAAILGLLFGAMVYAGYAFATEGWMMYAWMLGWGIAALAYPSMNALMSRQVPASAQGELQGGIASIYSLSAIVGPPVMAQLFGHFSSGEASVHFPGAPYLAAALLVLTGIALLMRATGPAGVAATARRAADA
jgi:MFS transporter, DHA1 family, tetracycline resistance protein